METSKNKFFDSAQKSKISDIKEAQKKIDEFVKVYGGYWTPLSQLARLVEEVGELSRSMNIKFGQKKSKFEGDGREINKELADVLFTLICIANLQKINLDEELSKVIEKDYKKCDGVYDKTIAREIKKKTWPEEFQKMLEGKKNTDIRLADFDIQEGDILVLEEYNPKIKAYTGRSIRKKVKNLNKIKLTDYHSVDNINERGHWVIELE